MHLHFNDLWRKEYIISLCANNDEVRILSIEVSSLVKKYGHHIVVNQLSFTASSGSIYGIIGPNGCGKTTTLRMLVGLIQPDHGVITIHGERPGKHLERIGVMFDYPNLYPYLTGYDNMRIFLPEQKTKETLSSSWLEKTGIQSYVANKVGGYSLGMKQRLLLTIMLIKNPEIWILDEPFTGLDTLGILFFQEILKEQANQGKIIVITSHDLNGLDTLLTDFCIMENGSVLQCGSRSDYNDFSDYYVRVLLGGKK